MPKGIFTRDPNRVYPRGDHGRLKAIPLWDRFFAKVNKKGPRFGPWKLHCWLWTTQLNDGGYGVISVNRKPQRAHRVAWQWYRGTIPQGLELDHLCRNRACVNPAHMELVTRQENLRRGIGIGGLVSRQQKAATHCKRGHRFDVANSYYSPSGGGRRCLTCKRNGDRNTRTLDKRKEQHVNSYAS